MIQFYDVIIEALEEVETYQLHDLRRHYNQIYCKILILSFLLIELILYFRVIKLGGTFVHNHHHEASR